MQDKDCLFCKIIAGALPCYKIYEDAHTFAFLDIAPSVEGHCLVVPKQHTRSFLTADADTIAKVMRSAQKVANYFVDSCGFTGARVSMNCEESAGQVVWHWHVHVLPYMDDTYAKSQKRIKPDASAERLAELHSKLKMM